MIKTLSLVASVLTTEKEAKTTRDDLYKLAAKTSLLMDEKQLTEKNTAHAEEPLRHLGVKLLNALSADAGSVKVEVLHSNLVRIREILGEILKPHISAKNYQKLIDAFGFYSDTKFLTSLIHDAKFTHEKKTVFDNLAKMFPAEMDKLRKQRARAKPIPCAAVASGCKQLAVRQQGQFNGSQFCPYHHMAVFEQKIKSPKLETFISNKNMATYLCQYLIQDEDNLCTENNTKKMLNGAKPLRLFHFARAVLAYKLVDRKLRRNRAEAVLQKYLNKNATGFVHVDDKHVAVAKKVMVESDVHNTAKGTKYGQKATFNAPPKDIFDVILGATNRVLQHIFDERYLKSRVHAMYLRTMSLPPYWKNMALKEVKKNGEAGKNASETKEEKQAS